MLGLVIKVPTVIGLIFQGLNLKDKTIRFSCFFYIFGKDLKVYCLLTTCDICCELIDE